MFKKVTTAPKVKLKYINGQYYMEKLCPVEVINDFSDGGIRVIAVKRQGSNHIRSFYVTGISRHRRLKHKMGLKGFILKKIGGR